MDLVAIYKVTMFIYLTLGAIGATCNIVALISLRRKKNLTVFNKTLLSLAVADLMLSLSFIYYPTLSLLHFYNIYHGKNLIDIGIRIMNIFASSSFWHIILIATQRFLAVIFPLRIGRLMTHRRFAISIIVVWILAGLYGGLVSLLPNQDFIYYNSILIFVCCTLMLILYSVISYKVHQKNKTIANTQERRIEKRGRTVLLHSIMVTAAFIFSYFPFATSTLFFPPNLLQTVICELFVPTNPILDSFSYFYIHYHRKRTERRAAKANVDKTGKNSATTQL